MFFERYFVRFCERCDARYFVRFFERSREASCVGSCATSPEASCEALFIFVEIKKNSYEINRSTFCIVRIWT